METELPKDKNGHVWTGKEKTFATEHGDIERLDYMALKNGEWMLVGTSGNEFLALSCTHITEDEWAELVYETKTDAPLVQELGNFIARCKELVDKDNNHWASDFDYVCRACGEHFSTCDGPNYCPYCAARVVHQ